MVHVCLLRIYLGLKVPCRYGVGGFYRVCPGFGLTCFRRGLGLGARGTFQCLRGGGGSDLYIKVGV